MKERLAGISPDSRRRALLLFGGWSILLFESAFLISPAGISPLIMDRLDLGASPVAWIVSAFILGQIVFSIPVGIVLDVRNERRILGLAALGLFAAGMVGTWAATVEDYPLLVATRFLAGIAGVTIVVAATNLVGKTFEGDTEATAVGLYSTGGPAGIALGQFAGPLIATRFGWPSPFLVFGLGTALAFVLVWLPARTVSIRTDDRSRVGFDQLRGAVTNPHIWQIGLLSFIAFSLFFFLSSTLPTYLTDTFDMPLEQSGVFLGLFTVVGMVARSGGGALSDYYFDSRRRPVAIISFAFGTVTTAAILQIHQRLLLLVVLMVAGFFVQLGMGLFYTYAREVVTAEVKGTGMSLFISLGLLGAFTAPIATGTLIDWTDGYVLAFGYAVVIGALGVVLAGLAPEPGT